MRTISALLLLTFCSFGKYPNSDDLGLRLQFIPQFNGHSLLLDLESKNDAFQVETFKCYLGSFQLLLGDSVVYSEADSYHLLDIEDPSSCVINFKDYHSVGSSFNKIRFLLGIDSTTNVSGAYGGDLDPTKGMYWAWNTGYVNFKLEGTSANSPARDKSFSYHLGGYTAPFATARVIELNVDQDAEQRYKIDIDSFLQQVNINEQHQVMSPGAEASALADIAAGIFSVFDGK